MGVQYGNGWVIPTGSSISNEPPVQFTTGVQQQQGGFFSSLVHLGQSPSMPFHPNQLFASGSQGSSQATLLPNAFNTTTLQDSVFGNWNMDTVGDGRFIPVTNSGHSVLSTLFRSHRLNNVLITPNIIKNLISIRQFVRDNSCTIEFDPFGFSVNDFITRRVLLRCDSMGDLYPVTKPSTIPHAFLTNLGALNYFLGISVTRDSSCMFLSQCKYAMEILECGTPVVDTESKLGDGGTLVVDPTLYRILAGSLYAEAEYRGVANAVVETCRIWNLLCELHTPLSSSTIVYCDN
nr:ribonuclease H-like domain-containing protein [Tanacetum cinerariifolium]